jgi:hypothetical protein
VEPVKLVALIFAHDGFDHTNTNKINTTNDTIITNTSTTDTTTTTTTTTIASDICGRLTCASHQTVKR